jgi:hypothetical protein
MPSRTATTLIVEALEARDVPSAAFQTDPIIPDNQAALDNARAIATVGQSQGRRTDAFMLLGDSNSAEFSPYAPGFLSPLGAPGYNPVASGLAASHPELLGTLSTFQDPVAGGQNSFDHTSVAAVPGYRAIDLLATYQSELATTNAGIALIAIGTNDVFFDTPIAVFESQLTKMVQTLAAEGVVPVLSTIPDCYYEGDIDEPGVLAINQAIADVASQNNVPLWNAWLGLQSLPNHGLQASGIHFDVSPNGGGSFFPGDLQYGQNVRNLEALQILNWYQTQVLGAPPPVAPFSSWTPLQSGEAVYAVGLGEGQTPAVSVYDSATGKEIDQFLPFAANFTGGVRVTVADVNGDGIPDIIVAAGPGGGPEVEVFSGANGSELANFFAFDPNFRNGISSVSAADLEGDGKADIVVGAAAGGGPVVAVFHGGDFSLAERFYAYNSSFRGGVEVATGTFAGIGPAIVTVPGPGGGPQIELFTYGSMTAATSFYTVDPSDPSGLAVTAADLTGSGSDQVIVGSVSGRPIVQVYNPLTGSNLGNFYAGPTTSLGGVRLGVMRGAGGTPDELLVGNGSGDAVSVTGFTGLSSTMIPLLPNDPSRAYGVYVG